MLHDHGSHDGGGHAHGSVKHSADGKLKRNRSADQAAAKTRESGSNLPGNGNGVTAFTKEDDLGLDKAPTGTLLFSL